MPRVNFHTFYSWYDISFDRAHMGLTKAHRIGADVWYFRHSVALPYSESLPKFWPFYGTILKAQNLFYIELRHSSCLMDGRTRKHSIIVHTTQKSTEHVLCANKKQSERKGFTFS